MSLKVLLINDFYSEGGAEGVCRKIENLLDSNSEISISFFYGSKEYKMPDSAKEYIHSMKYFHAVKKKIKKLNPDIIHLHNYYHLLSPSILKAIRECRERDLFRGKVVMTAHDYHLLCPESGFYYYSGNKIYPHQRIPNYWDLLTKRYDTRSWTYSLLKKIQWIYNYAYLNLQDQIDLILAPSNFLKEKYQEKFHNKDIKVVRNPYEVNLLSNNDTGGRTNNNLKLVFLGRVSAEKGLKEFIKALSRSKFNNYEFDIIGDGPEKEIISQLISSLCLDHKVKLLGRIPYEAVLQKISTYDTLVLPSIWLENAPLVIIEAVIAQIRIMTSNWGGMKELAEICEESYLINPHELDSVEDALFKNYRDVYEENKPLNRNIDKIKREFSEDLFKKKIKKIYSC